MGRISIRCAARRPSGCSGYTSGLPVPPAVVVRVSAAPPQNGRRGDEPERRWALARPGIACASGAAVGLPRRRDAARRGARRRRGGTRCGRREHDGPAAEIVARVPAMSGFRDRCRHPAAGRWTADDRSGWARRAAHPVTGENEPPVRLVGGWGDGDGSGRAGLPRRPGRPSAESHNACRSGAHAALDPQSNLSSRSSGANSGVCSPYLHIVEKTSNSLGAAIVAEDNRRPPVCRGRFGHIDDALDAIDRTNRSFSLRRAPSDMAAWWERSGRDVRRSRAAVVTRAGCRRCWRYGSADRHHHVMFGDAGGGGDELVDGTTGRIARPPTEGELPSVHGRRRDHAESGAAYAVETPTKSTALRRMGVEYEETRCRQAYRYHLHVADTLVAHAPCGSDADVGCGTGVVGGRSASE